MLNLRRYFPHLDKISSLPAVYNRITELIDDPNSSASDLGRVIEKDQALTARLLQIANSALWGLQKPVTTVARAVSILGFKQLRELVLALSVRETFRSMGQNSRITVRSFWEHSIACGIGSRILAIVQNLPNPETYFVAGFLHDIGQLLMIEHFPEKYAEVLERTHAGDRLAYEAEREIFGFGHDEVGGALCHAWRLPPEFVDAILHHHRPAHVGRARSLAATLHIADVLVHALQIGSSGTKLVPPLDKHAWAATGLQESLLETVVEKLLEQLQSTREFLLVN